MELIIQDMKSDCKRYVGCICLDGGVVSVMVVYWVQ